jgi:hypothetical protein
VLLTYVSLTLITSERETNSPQTIAFSLIDGIESRAADLQGQATSLHDTIEIAINSYDGLSLSKRAPGPISRVKRAMVAAAA